jgi:hypothetical protein
MEGGCLRRHTSDRRWVPAKVRPPEDPVPGNPSDKHQTMLGCVRARSKAWPDKSVTYVRIHVRTHIGPTLIGEPTHGQALGSKGGDEHHRKHPRTKARRAFPTYRPTISVYVRRSASTHARQHAQANACTHVHVRACVCTRVPVCPPVQCGLARYGVEERPAQGTLEQGTASARHQSICDVRAYVRTCVPPSACTYTYVHISVHLFLRPRLSLMLISKYVCIEKPSATSGYRNGCTHARTSVRTCIHVPISKRLDGHTDGPAHVRTYVHTCINAGVRTYCTNSR